MAYILDLDLDIKRPQEFNALRKFVDAYKEYLVALGDRLPKSVRDFVLTEWYWDYNSHRCPYDAWVESLEITEPADGQRHQNREIAIKSRLLAPYHDGKIEFKYSNVINYSLVMPVENNRRAQTGHDGWRIDEIRLSNDGNLIHEIRFKSGAQWLIESHNIEYTWIGGSDSGSGPSTRSRGQT